MPELSVIIPTFNRKECLRNCLESLARQTQSFSDFEVIVVIDGSTDGTQEMLGSYQAPYQLQVLEQLNSGQCKALNHGARAADGQILLFLDDDMVASPQLISRHIDIHRQYPHRIGIGKTTLVLQPNPDWFMLGFALEWEQHFEELDKNGRVLTWLDCYGSNMSISNADYHQVGGNLESLSRAYDLELAYRLVNHGCSITYLPDAVAIQDQRKGYLDLIKDAEKSGQACLELSKMHPEMQDLLLGGFPEQRPLIQTLLRLMLLSNISPQKYTHLFKYLGKPEHLKTKFQLLHRYAFWWSVKRSLSKNGDWHALTYGIPILMYHALGYSNEKAGRYIVPVSVFRKHLAWLKLAGYRVISLEKYISCRTSGNTPPARSVIITFDDGYADNYTLGLPLLKQYNYPAIIFLVTSAMGQANLWDSSSELTNRPILNWDQVRQLRREGISAGLHTRSHYDLTAISAEKVEPELLSSRDELERELGVKITTFSYPYGKYNGSIITVLQKAGFDAGCTTKIGKNSLAVPLHELRRVEIKGTDSIFQFIFSVRYGLDTLNIRKIFS